MKITVGRKLAAAFGFVLSIMALSGLVVLNQLLSIESSLSAIVDKATPQSNAAYEMEINLIGTGFGLLGYLEDRDQEHLNRVRGDIEEFREFHAIHRTLSDTIRGKDISSEIGLQFDLYEQLANNVILLENEQDEHVDTLFTNYATMDDLLDNNIQAAISSSNTSNYTKLEAVMELEINTNGIAKGLGEYLRTADSRYEARVMKDEGDFVHFFGQYEESGLNQQEQTWAAELEKIFSESVSLTQEIIRLNKEISTQRSEFVSLRRKMDELLDEGIQIITAQSLAQADSAAQDTIADATRSALFFLVFNAIFGVIAAIYISKSITSSIRNLSGTAKKISSGDLSARVKIRSRDELGELAATFNEMTLSLSNANKALEGQKDTLEKEVSLRTAELQTAGKSLESAVQERTDELELIKTGLEEKVAELENFYEATVDRELKLEELRNRVQELENTK